MTAELPKELVERVARAMAKAQGARINDGWRSKARVALREMLAAGEEAAAALQPLAAALEGLEPTNAEEPTPTRQAIPVSCEVTIPLASVTDMVRVLQDVPINARLSLRTTVTQYHGEPGIRILSQEELDRTRPRIVAVWEENR